MKRVFITSGQNRWIGLLPGERGLYDPHFTIPCAQGLVCSPKLDFEQYSTEQGFNVCLARIALADAIYHFHDGCMGDHVIIEIGFAIGIGKPIYVGCPRDIAKYSGWPSAATKLFKGTAAECWEMFQKEMS